MTVADGEPDGSTLVWEMVGSSGHSEEVWRTIYADIRRENTPNRMMA
jgi:hypothetical protein